MIEDGVFVAVAVEHVVFDTVEGTLQELEVIKNAEESVQISGMEAPITETN